jgi:hypothetical protein
MAMLLTKAFLSGASGEASSLAVDKIIGDENLQTIADATGLSKDQAGSIATSALINGMNAEILDAGQKFFRCRYRDACCKWCKYGNRKQSSHGS